MYNLIIGLVLLIGFICGIFVGIKWMLYRIRKNPEDVMLYLQEVNNDYLYKKHPELKNAVPLELDMDDDKFFIYNKTTSEFLSQGDTADVALDNLLSRFPYETFVYNDGKNLHLFSQKEFNDSSKLRGSNG